MLPRSLSARLLVLTIFFVMLAEVLIYVPSIARFRVDYLERKLDEAHLAVMALHATPAGLFDPDLQSRILRHAQLINVAIQLPGAYKVMVGAEIPDTVDEFYDLRDTVFTKLVTDAFTTLARSGDRILAVTGPSPKDDDAQVEVFLREVPLREAMIRYSGRILGLSVFISVMSATLVYYTLQWLMVGPMRRLTASITAFQAAPEDQSRIIRPSRRNDEIGLAERALSDMQQELRVALAQKARLAGVGIGVAKISHDLKGLLTSAMLESDRLEATAGSDPEIGALTTGICSALDRAVALCNHTLSFAKEGPPQPQPGAVPVRALIETVMAGLGGAGGEPVFDNGIPADLVVTADPELLRRVLDNLARNAVEAGAHRVWFRWVTEASGLLLRVGDDGPGLPTRARKNLFQPFAGSARPGGTGLGLPIARELMLAQGGDLALAQTGPDGTVFELRIGGNQQGT
ncbi:MAG: HAMP domain-containing histidine kinase [Alphaproteobacteria bacterium]|nr:HAMP domain-containing histidine kinase [Alphaproteobacteria bacterium]